MAISQNAAVSGIGVGQASLDALAALIPPSRYVSNSPMAVADVMSTLNPTTYNGMYQLTSDLYGVGGYLVSEGGLWKPVRQYATATINNADSDITFTPILHAPTQFLGGTLSASRTVTLSTTYAWNGARFTVKRVAAGALVNLLVKVGATLLGTQGANTWADYEFDGTTWQQVRSGGLL